MNSADLPFTQSFSGTCPSCRFILPPLDESSSTYFNQGTITCSNCGTPADLWKATLERLQATAGWIFSLAALGPKVTHFKLRLEANKGIEVDLTKFGIPASATILAINYTPWGGNALPVETHGNTPHRRIQGTKVCLYGLQMRTSEGVPIEEEFSGDNVNVMVVWAQEEETEIAWNYLIDAFESLALGKLSQAIVPAHSAAEICISRRIRSLLEQHASNERVGRFMKNELSFSSLLNVVLPVVCALIGAKPLPEVIRGQLNRLRELRNDFVHEGVLPQEVDSDEVRRLLCASVFGFHYGKYLDKYISSRRSVTGQ